MEVAVLKPSVGSFTPTAGNFRPVCGRTAGAIGAFSLSLSFWQNTFPIEGAEGAKMREALPSFTAVAPYYDHLMRVVPYRQWAEFVLRKAAELGIKGGRALDLACGTGNFSYLLAEAGFEVLGVDLSEPMVREARRKEAEFGGRLRFLVGDVRALPVREGAFDLATSVFDSLNYLLSEEDLRRAILEAGRALRPGGVLVFDLNTEYALSGGFFDQSNLGSNDWLHFEWRSCYDRRSKICTVRMKFWVDIGGVVREFTEVHRQRAHSEGEIVRAAEEAGLEVAGVFDNYTEKKASIFTDRAVWVMISRRKAGERGG